MIQNNIIFCTLAIACILCTLVSCEYTSWDNDSYCVIHNTTSEDLYIVVMTSDSIKENAYVPHHTESIYLFLGSKPHTDIVGIVSPIALSVYLNQDREIPIYQEVLLKEEDANKQTFLPSPDNYKEISWDKIPVDLHPDFDDFPHHAWVYELTITNEIFNQSENKD